MAMDDMFWGDYFGSFVDKFGIRWMISFNEEQSVWVNYLWILEVQLDLHL